MKRERFERDYNVKVDQLDWKIGLNDLFVYANIGPYTVYLDSVSGYYVTINNSVTHWLADLSKYL